MNLVSIILLGIACFVATSAQEIDENGREWTSGDWKPITGPRLEELLRLRDGRNIERR